MTWQAWLFLILPALAALTLGWTVRRWTVAVIAGVAALCLFMLVPGLGLLSLRPVVPFATGAWIAAFCLAVLLLFRPGSGRQTRIAVAVAPTFAAHFLYLQLALASR